MRFPRNTPIVRGHLDVAPFMLVFFLLLIFVMLCSLVYTPGVHVELPVSNGLSGAEGPMLAVAMDKSGRLYFKNQEVSKSDLDKRLREEVRKSPEPLTLVILADKEAPWEDVRNLGLLASAAGITNALSADRPRAFDAIPRADQ